MGAKAKKSLKKKMKKTSSSQISLSRRTSESSDFLVRFFCLCSISASSAPLDSALCLKLVYLQPLEGGPGRKITPEEVEPVKNTATVLYIGHIPHGFYEEQMEGNNFLCFARRNKLLDWVVEVTTICYDRILRAIWEN